MAENRQQLDNQHGIGLLIRAPAEISYFSRGFYQVEEDILYAPVFPAGRFYSYLDSSDSTAQRGNRNQIAISANLDVDSEGRLLFVQISTPRRQWSIIRNLSLPNTIEYADVRIIHFRDRIHCRSIQTSEDNSIARLVFAESKHPMIVSVADNLIFEITPDIKLGAIWIASIADDRAAKKMADWRKQIRHNSSSESIGPYKRIEIQDLLIP